MSALVKPVVVNVGRAGAANLDVIQEVEYVKMEAKIVYLLECLQKTAPPVLVFCSNQSDVDDIHMYLLLKGVDAVAIHGGKDQSERIKAIVDFKEGVKDVLVAIHEVQVTPDLKSADVFIGVVGAEAAGKEVIERLNNERGAIQGRLARRVVLKYTPRLHFRYDDRVANLRRLKSHQQQDHPEKDAQELSIRNGLVFAKNGTRLSTLSGSVAPCCRNKSSSYLYATSSSLLDTS